MVLPDRNLGEASLQFRRHEVKLVGGYILGNSITVTRLTSTKNTQSLSYVHGASAVPLLGQTIGEALDSAATRWADQLAVISCEQHLRLTWRALKERSDAFAAGLVASGCLPGERVGIWSLNCLEWVITQFAAAKAGLILVTINPAYRITELEYALNKVGCKTLVIAPSFKTSDYPQMLLRVAPELAYCAPGELRAARLPSLRTVIQIGIAPVPGTLAFLEVEGAGHAVGLAELQGVEKGIQFDDPVNIQFTSGTTGSPKGVALSHFNILNNGYFVGRVLGLGPDDRLCIPVPLYHCFGMVMGNLACLAHGSTMVYPGRGFDAAKTLEAVSAERCTVLYGVPTMFIAQLEHSQFAHFDLNSLRTGIMAGSVCPTEVMRRVSDLMRLPELTICYGMTETSPVSFQSARSDTLERRVSTVGRIQDHVESKIIDSDGRILARGEPGEICTRGYSVMLGYWDDDEQTKLVKDAAGWMHTGDLGTIDADGYCRIVGRIKDMVIRGGENLYPREVEEFLYTHSAIRDVQVFGVADERYGEELCAWVILHEPGSVDADAIRSFCRDNISHQKIPRYICFVDEFPMTVTGKVQKYLMREIMQTRLLKSTPS
jgi:fatty-acyl-CoA synthase